MWYKIGLAKTSLRTGKMLGMAAGLLIFLQLPLAGRLKVLDRIFSLPALIRQHRWHAWAVVFMVLSHPLCVLLPEGNLMVPMEIRYWPEWVGVGLLAIILVQFACTLWRQPIGLAYHRWLPGHRIVGLLITVMLIVHVLYVSEAFTDNWSPRLAVLTVAAIFALLWMWVRTARLRIRCAPYRVTRAASIAQDCTRVEVTPAGGVTLAYLPGQFVFVSFAGQYLSREPHTFTLASSPTRPGEIQFAIRACGDWTRQVSRLVAGDRAYLQGPFGRFSHRLIPSRQELIMIAGGIGITPMLSMLRYMADTNDPRRITLIWSNRSPAHMVFAGEMDLLAAKLTGLRRVPIFTRIPEEGAPTGRLNRKSLEAILNGCSRDCAVFLCGPPGMMTRVKKDLKSLNFVSHRIFSETFGF